MDSLQHVSFIGIVDFTEDARWVYASESVTDLLGYDVGEIVGRPALDLVHPDEFPQVRAMHYDTIKQDKAAVLAYLRMKHKDPTKGYILCGITRTVCQNVLVGSVSYASLGPRAMHNNSTAQEVTVVTPWAKDLEFRKWSDTNPMPPCTLPSEMLGYPNGVYYPPPSRSSPHYQPPPQTITFAPLPPMSRRTALILDRFTERSTVVYCSNDSIVKTLNIMGRTFYDFVVPKDEDRVKDWIVTVKGWGVNERGQPSNGGFGFGKFTMCVEGRDSSATTDPVPSSRNGRNHTKNNRHRDRGIWGDRPRGYSYSYGEEVVVDAIFSAHSDGLMVILRPSS